MGFDGKAKDDYDNDHDHEKRPPITSFPGLPREFRADGGRCPPTFLNARPRARVARDMQWA